MRRERLEIIVKVLQCCETEAIKTRVVYGANLNFRLADKYLNHLVDRGFVEVNGDKFITTEKGKAFLEKAKEVLLQF